MNVPPELWLNCLYKHRDEQISRGDVMCPYKISDNEGRLVGSDLVYLPLGQPLDGEWSEFESEE